MLQSYIFRDKSRHITARRVRSHGAITLSEMGDVESDPKPHSITTHHTAPSSIRTTKSGTRTGTPPLNMGSPKPVGSPEKDESGWASLFSPAQTLRNARQSILPSYHSSAPVKGVRHSRSSSTYSRSTSGETKKTFKWKKQKRDSSVRPPLQISAPINVNPQFAHLLKPNLAHHPSTRRPGDI